MDNLFQGVGLVACIGSILLVVLVAVLARKAFGGRTPGSMQREDDPFVNRGQEQPRYDSDRVESSGGFGAAPRQTRQERDFDSMQTGFGQDRDLDERPSRPINRDRDNRPSRPLHRDQDDDVSSRGGFGG